MEQVSLLDESIGPGVVCRGVTKEFVAGEARVQALRGVDLQVARGQLTLLVGPSGCGKTTLISVIAALLDATGGEVDVLGTNLTRLTPRQKVDFRRRHIGFVFQQYNLLPALTAAENVAVPLVIPGWKRKDAVAKAHQLLESVRLADRAEALPAQLSGGQQQRVAIARALVHEPRLLVCDEPTAALDAQLGQEVLGLIRQVAVQPNRAVIVVTHDSRVFGFGDQIVHMNDGRIERIESRLDGTTAEKVSGTFFGPALQRPRSPITRSKKVPDTFSAASGK
jgi:putative ABC transport system ATP-binding protein